MDVRQFALGSPARVVAGALVTILAFAVLFPFVGGIQETVGQTGVTITYTAEWSDAIEPKYLFNIFVKSLHLSA